jgi:hypothetical protein
LTPSGRSSQTTWHPPDPSKLHLSESRAPYCVRSISSTYNHGSEKRFLSAIPYRGGVVHHALINVLEPLDERCFLHDSYAYRKSKGTHAAMRRAEHFAKGETDEGLDVAQQIVVEGVLLVIRPARWQGARVTGYTSPSGWDTRSPLRRRRLDEDDATSGCCPGYNTAAPLAVYPYLSHDLHCGGEP